TCALPILEAPGMGIIRPRRRLDVYRRTAAPRDVALRLAEEPLPESRPAASRVDHDPVEVPARGRHRDRPPDAISDRSAVEIDEQDVVAALPAVAAQRLDELDGNTLLDPREDAGAACQPAERSGVRLARSWSQPQTVALSRRLRRCAIARCSPCHRSSEQCPAFNRRLTASARARAAALRGVGEQPGYRRRERDVRGAERGRETGIR